MNLSNTQVMTQTQDVGPRHDPYSRTTITVTRDDVEHVLVMCGLAGGSYERDGVMRVDASLSRHAEEVFAAATGATVDEWFDWDARLHSCEDDPMGSLSQYV